MSERYPQSAPATGLSTHSLSRQGIQDSPISPAETSPTLRASSKRRTGNSPAAINRPPISARNSSYRSPQLRIATDSSRISPSPMASAPSPVTPLRQDSRSTDGGVASIVNPTSTILQGLIKEQRATRGSRRTVSDYIEDVAMVTPPASRSNEETASDKQRKVNTAIPSGHKQPREMGIREMDQYVSKMNKLNFDLKLEIFHRTQQMKLLEKKLGKMQQIEEELEQMQGLKDEVQELRAVEETNQRLREANEQLQLELDKRDLAINEAVQLICQLENKIEELQAPCDDDSRPSTARPKDDSNVLTGTPSTPEISTPKAQISVEIPDRTSSKRGTVRRPRKSPSFLRSEIGSASALRSLYLKEENQSLRSVSASTQATSRDFEVELESPRLSMLSDCSYLDLSDPPLQLRQKAESETGTESSLADASTSESQSLMKSNHGHDLDRINKWIPLTEDLPIAPVKKQDSDLTVSCGDDEIPETNIPNHDAISTLDTEENPSIFCLETPRISNIPNFGGQLPPTPDTMRTSRLGARNGSAVSIRGHGTHSIRTLSRDRGSLRRDWNRPRTADDITTRPSSPMSTMSDGAETRMSDCAEYPSSFREREEVTGLFHSFNYFGEGSAIAARLHGSNGSKNLRSTSYGGDLMFNGEGIEEIASEDRTNLPSSIEPTSSTEPLQSGPSRELLSAQDWLDAANMPPRSRKERVRMDSTEQSRHPRTTTIKLVESSATAISASPARPKTADSQDVDLADKDDSQMRRNPALRLRAWANNTSLSPDAQQKKRFSLRPRFLSRSYTSASQQHTESAAIPTHVDHTPSTSSSSGNILRRHRRSGSGPTSFGEIRNSANGQDGSRQLLQGPVHIRPSTGARPTTSDCADHRRTSSGFFGWMKGSGGSGSHHLEAENPTIRNRPSVISAHQTATSSKPPSDPVTARPDLYPPTTGTGINVAELPTTSAGVAEEESDWRSRRRSRRMA